jgi:hypothetical protein
MLFQLPCRGIKTLINKRLPRHLGASCVFFRAPADRFSQSGAFCVGHFTYSQWAGKICPGESSTRPKPPRSAFRLELLLQIGVQTLYTFCSPDGRCQPISHNFLFVVFQRVVTAGPGLRTNKTVGVARRSHLAHLIWRATTSHEVQTDGRRDRGSNNFTVAHGARQKMG